MFDTGTLIALIFGFIIFLCVIAAIFSMQSTLKVIQQYLYVLLHANVPEDDIKRLLKQYEEECTAAEETSDSENDDPADDTSKE